MIYEVKVLITVGEIARWDKYYFEDPALAKKSVKITYSKVNPAPHIIKTGLFGEFNVYEDHTLVVTCRRWAQTLPRIETSPTHF